VENSIGIGPSAGGLMARSSAGGCACKLRPDVLERVVGGLVGSRGLAAPASPLLVGVESGDDAAVWQLSEDLAIVATCDFITPIVDDPATWGRIAATNAVSDVYAMGGRPLLALNLVCWDPELPEALLADVLGGAAQVAEAAGFVIAGGHSVVDREPKFGLAVVGTVAPRGLVTNSRLGAGDVLVLTKPLGAGIITTALRQGCATNESLAAAVAAMTTLNDKGARIALDHGVTAMTDVTGFGLLGHLHKMAASSGVSVTLDASAVPVLPGALELAERGVASGGGRRNLEWVRPDLAAGSTGEPTLALLADPQTSGGLLAGFGRNDATAALEACSAAGLEAAVVGEAHAGEGEIIVSGEIRSH
jgi:selenide,water dikinase